jgi:hypothetical protein
MKSGYCFTLHEDSLTEQIVNVTKHGVVGASHLGVELRAPIQELSSNQ